MNIGFMQGRLSPLVDGKIQAFPWEHWRSEFKTAAANGFTLMEWTLDQKGLHDNPFMTAAGQKEILDLAAQHKVKIGSLTGDCFMQAPFWKSAGVVSEELLEDFRNIIKACSILGVRYIVVPLVDNGSIETADQKQSLLSGMKQLQTILDECGLFVVFESDFPPKALAQLIAKLDRNYFGINYDIGNSAAANFDPVEEISAYGDRIKNVHVKDRPLGGTTVPLGEGNANFKAVFATLAKYHYSGNFILQTARADDGEHAKVLVNYKSMVSKWLNQ